jgi:imidazolonepropionase-like amidohydrolase
MAFVLRGGTVWDGRSDTASEAAVAVDSVIAGSAGAGENIDISGCTVVPGLMEAHAHLCFNGEPNWRQVYDADSPVRMALRMAGNGRTMLEAGITTVRDLGAPTATSIEVRDAFAKGLVAGPDLLVAGAPITTTGGHCHFMGGEADGELEVRRAVRERVKAGCDWIKVMATGGNMTRGTNTLAAQYTVPELRACIEEAHRLRLRVAAHCHGTAGIRAAVEAGIDMLEHCSFTGEGRIDFDPAVVEAIAAKGIIVSPTVSIGWRKWADDGLRRARADALKTMFARGCKVIMSTDCGIPGVPHAALAGALDVLSEYATMPPVETLKLATSRAAELLDLPDRGVIAEGKRADLLVVEGDPLSDLLALQRVRLVVKAGEIVFRR